ncbi:MAG TPA: hypothetical protein VJ933_02085 [Phaeodactylibacter sp.]|nr:hypothetical protein [Phaeodactylibacter sp.]
MLDQAIPILRRDERLRPAVGKGDLPPLNLDYDLYAGLIRSVVHQQLSGKAAHTIHQRLLALFPDGYPHLELLLKLDTSELRAVGLSRQKADYVANVAYFFQSRDQQTLLQLEDNALIQELTQIKGIGKWTVQMILIFNLGRPDVFPPDDLGIQKAMQRLYDLPTKGRKMKQQMRTIAEAWHPYRSVATRFLWQYLD